jgi:hypothetical protein
MKRLAIAALATFGVLLAAMPAARAADTQCNTTISGGTINGNLAVPNGATCFLGKNVVVTGNVEVGAGAGLEVVGATIGGNIQAEQCNFMELSPSFVGGSEPGPISVGGNVQIQHCTGTGSGFEQFTNQYPITINGNFVCEDNSTPCGAVGGTVRGNVRIANNLFPFSTTLVSMNTIGGNVQVINSGPSGDVDTNTVGGNVEFDGNTGGGGFVYSNNVDGNLQVDDNTGGSTDIDTNTVGGNLTCQGNTPPPSNFGFSKNTVAGNKLGQCAGL